MICNSSQNGKQKKLLVIGLHNTYIVSWIVWEEIEQNSEKMLGFKIWLKGDFGSFNLANYRFLGQNGSPNTHVISLDLIFPLEISLSK